MILRCSALLMLLMLLPVSAQAVVFRASIDESVWEMETSRFFCRLSQAVPAFGRAVFEHEAGERLRFELRPTQKYQLDGEARLIARASPWQPGVAPVNLGRVEISAESGGFSLGSELANAMLVALHKGMTPTFASDEWFDTNEPVEVGISAANFQSAYDDYLGCLTTLLPVNYRQVARTAVLFPSAAWRLSDATRERLGLIALYVKTDDSVKSIYVDGHSDNYGRRLLNRDLSKKRAEEVTRYLVSQGIPEDMITTRYHGERYPVVPNTSAENRARNRRVAIRLERE
ncbi:flagellar protein MotY [Marinobacterium stanieri]|uniref:OmpA family protein n=1 Tax=Marinobacterium stanieri TaxID=49186 RepID=A0A1N6P6C0_9GAMM|nr:OmpA family protein [Marinobacterium stanieri]SIP99712.1 OmpA family protein [Marinobacterium stanieri]